MADTNNIAFAYLRLPDGTCALQRRTNDEPVSPGLLSFFGGHIEADETSHDAIVREISEETSLDLKHGDFKKLLTVKFDPRGTNKEKEYTLFVADTNRENFEVYEGEGSEVYSIDELLQRDDVAPGTINVIQLAKQKGLI